MSADPEERVWLIGQLAHAVGLSVRALRFYDQQGLLSPARRSPAGYRLYGGEDMHRLYRIVGLRRLGLSLRDIRAVLDGASGELSTIVERQLEQVQRQVVAAQDLHERLTGVLATVSRRNSATPEQLIEVMEAMSMEIRLDRIYTRTGDDGFTETGGDNGRVAKTDGRFEAAGTIDELTSHLGLAAATLHFDDGMHALITSVQQDLFDLRTARDLDARVRWLEERCDEFNQELPPLDSFVLPGGSLGSAQLQISRTVCRRAERNVLDTVDIDRVEIARYLNRLSDLLFILARAANTEPELLWQRGSQ